MEDLSKSLTLYNFIEQIPLTEQQSLLICRNMCRAVAELHAVDIVHGDLASENIMIDPQTLTVKIIDFDLSSKVGSMVYAGGNEHFVDSEMNLAIKEKRKVES